MPFERNRDLDTVIKKSMLTMHAELSTILHGAPIIRDHAHHHIHSMITYAIRNAFRSVPPVHRSALYRQLALILHPDKLEIRNPNLSHPKDKFRQHYMQWVNQNPEFNRETLKGSFITIMDELQKEYETDFDYAITYQASLLSWCDRAQLNTLQYQKRYHAIMNPILTFLRILCLMSILIFLLLSPFLIAINILAQITPLSMVPYVSAFLELLTMHIVTFHIQLHFSQSYGLMFGDMVYKNTLKTFISEQELADYLRTQYAAEVDLSTETNARVFAYCQEKQLDSDKGWDNYERQQRKSHLARALAFQYDLDHYFLLELYSKTFTGIRHAAFLLSAMHRMLRAPLPIREIAWTTQQKTPTDYDYVDYTKKSSRKHVLVKIGHNSTSFLALEPWRRPNDHAQTVHLIDRALYEWDRTENALKKLNYTAPSLRSLPDYVVRTADSLFMLSGNNLVRLDIDSPSGTQPKPQYIQMEDEDRLFFYDGIQDVCQTVHTDVQALLRRFPRGTQINTLSDEDMTFIASVAEHRPNRWYWLKTLQAIVIKLLRMLCFLPFLALESAARLLLQIPVDSILLKAKDAVELATTSAFKLPLDIYDHFHNPESPSPRLG